MAKEIAAPKGISTPEDVQILAAIHEIESEGKLVSVPMVVSRTEADIDRVEELVAEFLAKPALTVPQPAAPTVAPAKAPAKKTLGKTSGKTASAPPTLANAPESASPNDMPPEALSAVDPPVAAVQQPALTPPTPPAALQASGIPATAPQAASQAMAPATPADTGLADRLASAEAEAARLRQELAVAKAVEAELRRENDRLWSLVEKARGA